MSGLYSRMGVVLLPKLGLTRGGLGFEDKDVEFHFRHVKFEVVGWHLKGGFLVGDWVCGSVAQKSERWMPSTSTE